MVPECGDVSICPWSGEGLKIVFPKCAPKTKQPTNRPTNQTNKNNRPTEQTNNKQTINQSNRVGQHSLNPLLHPYSRACNLFISCLHQCPPRPVSPTPARTEALASKETAASAAPVLLDLLGNSVKLVKPFINDTMYITLTDQAYVESGILFDLAPPTVSE